MAWWILPSVTPNVDAVTHCVVYQTKLSLHIKVGNYLQYLAIEIIKGSYTVCL